MKDYLTLDEIAELTGKSEKEILKEYRKGELELKKTMSKKDTLELFDISNSQLKRKRKKVKIESQTGVEKRYSKDELLRIAEICTKSFEHYAYKIEKFFGEDKKSDIYEQMKNCFYMVIETIKKQDKRIKEMENKKDERMYLDKPIKEPIFEMHQIIRDYVSRNDLKYNEVYRKFYEEFKYYYHIDLLIRAINSGKRAVEIIRELHKEKEALALAKKLFGKEQKC